MLKIVMRCTTPVHDAAGNVVFQPGDLLPDGDPDAVGWVWVPTIVEVLDPPTVREVQDPHPESSVRDVPAVAKPTAGIPARKGA